ncbi:MAG TPA: hypothetical protein ENJ87_13285 [Gammaproteobacteria bacterium]|nr:hypothetical protein [Gammaproteobacteria bacterium]
MQKFIIAIVIVVVSDVVVAQGVRDHTRMDDVSRVTVSQAEDLTLVVVKAEKQNLQTWIRVAAILDVLKKKVTARVCEKSVDFIKMGQRVRSFPPASKSSIYQSRVSEISKDGSCVIVSAVLPKEVYEVQLQYVMEIIVHRGNYLSIPNEAIIEEADHQLVYIESDAGHYVPKMIRTGIIGELYTQILQGVEAGDKVVTFGSFFIDADNKLNKTKKDSMGHAHHHH